MSKPDVLKEVVTVSEMARMCGLSRARYYQLAKEGIFPTPSRNPQTGRPYYDRKQQELCLLIRRTNKGANGRVVLFYGRRLETVPRLPSKRQRVIRKNPNVTPVGISPVLVELRSGLTQLGMSDVSMDQIRNALATALPDGLDGRDEGEVLQAVFTQLGCRNSDDNVSG